MALLSIGHENPLEEQIEFQLGPPLALVNTISEETTKKSICCAARRNIGGSGEHFRYQRAPRGLGWGRLAAVFLPGFLYMASSAKRLATVRVVGILARLNMQRDHMIGLKPPGPAAIAAPVAGPAKHGAPRRLPAAPVQADMVAAHRY